MSDFRGNRVTGDPGRRPIREHGKKKVDLAQRKRWALGSGALLTLVGIGVAFWLAPWQEERVQKSVEEKKDSQLAKAPAFTAEVTEVWDDGVDGYTWVFPEELALSRLRTLEHEMFNVAVDPHRMKAIAEAARLQGRRAGAMCAVPDGEQRPVCTPVSRYKVTLTGNRTDKVHITHLSAHVISEQPAPTGTITSGPPEGGGDVDDVYLDLDSPDKEAVTVDEQNHPTNTAFTLAKNRWAEEGEPLDFIVTAGTTSKADYTWELVVGVSYDGKKESIRIRNESGAPFSTTGWNYRWDYRARYLIDISQNRIRPDNRPKNSP